MENLHFLGLYSEKNLYARPPFGLVFFSIDLDGSSKYKYLTFRKKVSGKGTLYYWV